MAFGFDKNPLCINQKRCFLILLLFNSFVACIYYLSGSISQTTKTTPIDTNLNQKHNHAIKFIRTILENEYDHEDLITFYNLVEKEFSLGLRCTRKANPPPTTTTTLLTADNQQSNSSIITIRYLNTKMVRFFSSSSIDIRDKRNVLLHMVTYISTLLLYEIMQIKNLIFLYRFFVEIKRKRIFSSVILIRQVMTAK
jgi:hypothetical protein